jgi:hypothetical protein
VSHLFGRTRLVVIQFLYFLPLNQLYRSNRLQLFEHGDIASAAVCRRC